MLALYSNPRLLSVVRGAVERLAETLGFSAVQCGSITRAVDEAMTNIVRRSACSSRDGNSGQLSPAEFRSSRLKL